MSPAKPLLLTISLLSALPWCTVASDGKPLVTAITKDASTSLYTVPIKDTHPLVLDLSGPLIWSTCDASHPTVQLYERDCMEANRYTPPGCWTYTDQDEPYPGNKCTAHPYNPFTGECASGDLIRTTLSANATDGKNPLYPVSFSAIASCAPDSLLASLPAGAVGVAGLGRSELALPAQVASAQNVSRKFALCLPSGGQGVAIFGGGPVFLLPPWLQEITSIMGFTPLHRYQESPGYYICIKGINVNQQQVPLNDHGPLVVGFDSRIPYTALRPDVYRPFVQAFDNATSGVPRVTPAVAPFELCYVKDALGSTRAGYAVPQIDLVLEDDTRWGLFGANSMVQANDGTVCLAFVEMKAERHGQAPAMVMGGFQMENNLLVFDAEKGQLGFSTLLFFRRTTCSNFNFTLTA